jgi:hypothetical protein
MTQIPQAGWYRDPTSTYEYRYWDGGGWTERVSTGGTAGTDPNPLDSTVAATPPAPGSAAPSPPAAAPAPSVQVTQSGGGGSSFGTIIGVVIAVVAIVVLIVVLVAIAGDGDSSDASVPAVDTPVETEAPAPTEAPATTAGS